MKILCFGDSNTWGYDPEDGHRLAKPWTVVLQELMPADKILTYGMCGRTAQGTRPTISGSDGQKAFFRRYTNDSFRADWLVLMLGSNDMTNCFTDHEVEHIAQALRRYIRAFREVPTHAEAGILVIAPPPIGSAVLTHPMFGEFFDEHSIEKSRQFAAVLEKMATEEQVSFLDAGKIVSPSQIDGLHLTEPEHRKLAMAVYHILNKSADEH
ncbi:MAG: GDSL-type esterase/lipase family protein [Lachnospiraceae bacterium]|nr:GDSL-type esterase/lipase family protein [Lachnospiraceae bacterium]